MLKDVKGTTTGQSRTDPPFDQEQKPGDWSCISSNSTKQQQTRHSGVWGSQFSFQPWVKAVCKAVG